jgi:hypothetical protein
MPYPAGSAESSDSLRDGLASPPDPFNPPSGEDSPAPAGGDSPPPASPDGPCGDRSALIAFVVTEIALLSFFTLMYMLKADTHTTIKYAVWATLLAAVVIFTRRSVTLIVRTLFDLLKNSGK